jgi:hypothetical protein
MSNVKVIVSWKGHLYQEHKILTIFILKFQNKVQAIF